MPTRCAAVSRACPRVGAARSTVRSIGCQPRSEHRIAAARAGHDEAARRVRRDVLEGTRPRPCHDLLAVGRCAVCVGPASTEAHGRCRSHARSPRSPATPSSMTPRPTHRAESHSTTRRSGSSTPSVDASKNEPPRARPCSTGRLRVHRVGRPTCFRTRMKRPVIVSGCRGSEPSRRLLIAGSSPSSRRSVPSWFTRRSDRRSNLDRDPDRDLSRPPEIRCSPAVTDATAERQIAHRSGGDREIPTPNPSPGPH